jgi:hypothetical protein
MDAIIAALDHLELGMPVTAANLTMYPLLVPDESAPGYLTLDEALAAGLASVTEVSEAGSVPELLVKNHARMPILILDGEELVGAKQNRIVNLTILVAAGQTLHIPVSCVEAGRWARRSREFASAGRAHFASGRARKLEQVSFSMRESGSRMADQCAVWQDIDDKAGRLMTESPTNAAAAMYDGHRSKLDEFAETLEATPRQAGAVFTINGVVAGVDLFDSPATWRKSMRKLVQSYGLDALDRAEAGGHAGASKGGSDAQPQPTRFLSTLKKAARERFPAIGLGEDVRINGTTIVGGGLVVDDRVIHLVAFPGTRSRGRG